MSLCNEFNGFLYHCLWSGSGKIISKFFFVEEFIKGTMYKSSSLCYGLSLKSNWTHFFDNIVVIACNNDVKVGVTSIFLKAIAIKGHNSSGGVGTTHDNIYDGSPAGTHIHFHANLRDNWSSSTHFRKIINRKSVEIPLYCIIHPTQCTLKIYGEDFVTATTKDTYSGFNPMNNNLCFQVNLKPCHSSPISLHVTHQLKQLA